MIIIINMFFVIKRNLYLLNFSLTMLMKRLKYIKSIFRRRW